MADPWGAGIGDDDTRIEEGAGQLGTEFGRSVPAIIVRVQVVAREPRFRAAWYLDG